MWCSGRWTATRDHDTEGMAEVTGAGESVDGGAVRRGLRRQWYMLFGCWMCECAARIEVGASASQASERWHWVGDERWTCFHARAARNARAFLEDSPARRFTIHDSRLWTRTEPVPHIPTPGTRTQTSRACIWAGPL